MAIEIEETFEVAAPIDLVWRFVTTPELIVACLPGASLAEVLDDRNFLGRVKVKLGAVTAAYKGKITFTEVDDANHVLRMLGEGKDPSGGTAKASICCSLAEKEGGLVEMTTSAEIDLTGKVMQVGRGMIKGVSHQLFLQFAKTARSRLEAEAAEQGVGADSGAATEGEGSSVPAPSQAASSALAEEVPLNVFSLLMKTIWAAIVNFFKKLFGQGKK